MSSCGQNRTRLQHIGETRDPIEIDPDMPHAARMYDYLAGGSTNFEIDRQTVERAAQAVGGIDNARADVRANRVFLGRVVRWLINERGVRQFLDIGTGVPNSDNVQAIVSQAAPAARLVCVDNDPIVLAHAHQLLRPSSYGVVEFVAGDVRDPDSVVDAAAKTLDLSQPVAILLIAVLHLVPDEEDPHGIVARLVDRIAPGSYLAISHLTQDIAPAAMAALAERLNARARDTFVMRDFSSVIRFFDGLDPIEPGVVQVDQWRPGYLRPRPVNGQWVPAFYGGVARTSARSPGVRHRPARGNGPAQKGRTHMNDLPQPTTASPRRHA
jgi:trans-aconitate methyltransferase